MNSKFETKLTNFKDAYERLSVAIEEFKQPNASTVIQDGVIQRFEFTYELAWKTIKVFLEDQGIVEVNSPKGVIKEAYALKLLVDEKNWLLMLNDRNMTSHMYKKEMAKEIAERISLYYIKEFDMLLHKFQQ